MVDADAAWALTVMAITACLLQGMKVVLDVIRTHQFQRRYLRSSGGFPSFHAGISASVVTIIFHEQGISLLFVVALVFAFLLWYDAINVRHEAGKHALYLNSIKGELFNVFSRGDRHTLNERIGHTLPELVAGIIIGVVVTSMLYFL